MLLSPVPEIYQFIFLRQPWLFGEFLLEGEGGRGAEGQRAGRKGRGEGECTSSRSGKGEGQSGGGGEGKSRREREKGQREEERRAGGEPQSPRGHMH